MPFNPAQFVTPLHPLGQFDLGRGFRALAEQQHRERALTEQARQANMLNREQQDSRRDTNTRFSAQLASNQGDAQYSAATKRWEEAQKLAIELGKAVAAGDHNTADVLGPRLVELGGTFQRRGDPMAPDYTWRAPDTPQRQQLDYGRTRRDIFGAPGGTIGQPFMMRGSNPAQGNPFEMLPGASAAMLPQPAPAPQAPAEPPPPGAASDPTAGGSGTPPAGVADIPRVPPAEGPPQPVDPNQPLPEVPNLQLQQPDASQGVPTFDPYTVSTRTLMARNSSRTRPYLEGFAKGFPGNESRFGALNEGILKLGYDPETSLKLGQQGLNAVAGGIGDELRAESAKASLGLRGEAMQFSQSQQLRNFAKNRVDNVARLHKLPEHLEKVSEIDRARKMLELRNPNADAAGVAILRDLVERGIMTDSDYDRAKAGIVTYFQKFKNGIIEGFGANGLNPDARANMLEMIDAGSALSRRKIEEIQSQMLNRAENDRTLAPEEYAEVVNSTADAIPRDYWSPFLVQQMETRMPQKSGPVDKAGNIPVTPPAGEDLGVAPLPRTLDGRASTSTSKTTKGKAKDKKPGRYDGIPGLTEKTKRLLEEADELLKD